MLIHYFSFLFYVLRRWTVLFKWNQQTATTEEVSVSRIISRDPTTKLALSHHRNELDVISYRPLPLSILCVYNTSCVFRSSITPPLFLSFSFLSLSFHIHRNARARIRKKMSVMSHASNLFKKKKSQMFFAVGEHCRAIYVTFWWDEWWIDPAILYPHANKRNLDFHL